MRLEKPMWLLTLYRYFLLQKKEIPTLSRLLKHWSPDLVRPFWGFSTVCTPRIYLVKARARVQMSPGLPGRWKRNTWANLGCKMCW